MRRSFYLCGCGRVFAGRSIGGHRTKGACNKKYGPISRAEYEKCLHGPANAKKKATTGVPLVIRARPGDELLALRDRQVELKMTYDLAKDKYQAFMASLQKLLEEQD